MSKKSILKFVSHGGMPTTIARQFGWNPAARYTELRHIKDFQRICLVDINWKNYSFQRHLSALKVVRPMMTVARDIESIDELDVILDEANDLSKYADAVILVPKDERLSNELNYLIPEQYILGFSVQTNYGQTEIPPSAFKRPVHLLGGRPDVQRKLADLMPVVSMDCNRFTFDAKFGDYFDGESFRPHPIGGYNLCLSDSVRNINKIWDDYVPPDFLIG